MALSQASGALPQAPDQDASRLDWWRAARFGLFIHWGPVSIKGTEIGWSRGEQVPIAEYDQLYREFNPVRFDANAWARMAKKSGMKYVVLTTKHHDGFCLWNTRHTDYNIMHTPFRRDVVKELAAACRKHGLVFGTYHSICDWYHSDYPLGSPGGKTTKPQPNMDRYSRYLKDQLAELVLNYGPLGMLWFDGEWESPWTHERGVDLYQYVRALQPDIIINNRVDIGREGMAGTTVAGTAVGDFDTPEQRIGQFQNQRPWESCITIGQQWAWKPNDTLKSLKECLQTLVACAGGDGNLLLNIGPMPTGEIEPRQAARLLEMGGWLRRYGKTIYQTRGGPFKPGAWGASTFQAHTIYLHVFTWPASGLVLPPIPRTVQSVKALTGGKARLTQTPDNLTLTLPSRYQQEIDTIIALELDGPAQDIAPRQVGSDRIR